MRKVFIADAHLRNPVDHNYRKLLRFLQSLEGEAEILFIMGDLFEFWIGYRHPPFTQYYPLLDQLGRLVTGGTKLIYFEGNHDFHMGPYFREILKADIHPGPAVLEIDGKKVYLCHGDQINRADRGYGILRFILHNPLSRTMVPIVPVGLVTRIADRMGRMSRKGHNQRRLRWDYPAIMRQFAADRFADGCDLVVTGHFHTPLLDITSRGTLLSLGDWITHFTYGEWTGSDIALKVFEEPDGVVPHA